MRNLTLLILFAALIPATISLYSAETPPVQKPGIKTLQLVSDLNAVQPGQEISVGLFIQHIPEYHTYWKAPGIVGVPTTINWELPKNFTADAIEWPVPEITKMAQYTCYGYEHDTCLITRVSVPDVIEGESVTLKARVAFMCCAKTCHPGWHDVEITLPVNRTNRPEFDRKWQKKFVEYRSKTPPEAPENWSITASDSGKEITITITSPDKMFPVGENLYCFCEDNQIDSDHPLTIEWSDDKQQLTFTLVKSGFGPENLKKFTGLLYHPDGWPGASSKWVSFSAPLLSP